MKRINDTFNNNDDFDSNDNFDDFCNFCNYSNFDNCSNFCDYSNYSIKVEKVDFANWVGASKSSGSGGWMVDGW